MIAPEIQGSHLNLSSNSKYLYSTRKGYFTRSFANLLTSLKTPVLELVYF